MNQKFIKENEILLFNEGKTYKLTLKLESKEKIILKVQQENNHQIIPHFYQRVLTIDQLPSRSDDILIRNMQLVLKAINSSSKNNQLDFSIQTKSIKLSYVLYEEENEIDIPLCFNVEIDEIIYKLSSGLSETTKKLNQFLKKNGFWQRVLKV